MASHDNRAWQLVGHSNKGLLAGLVWLVLVLLAVGLPAGYFAIGYSAQASALRTKVEVKAEVIGQLIGRNPELWRFEDLRLRDLLVRLPQEPPEERARIVSLQGELIAESPHATPWPAMARSALLYDAGTPVGRVEVRHSIRQLLAETALSAAFSLASAAALFAMLRRLIASNERIAAAMADEQERARDTLQSIGDAVITTDAQERIEYLNPVAALLTQWRLEEARGRALDEVCHLVDEGTGAPLATPLTRAMRERRHAASDEARVALLRRDGSLLAIETSAAPLRNANGVLSGGAMVFRDVTEARRLAQRITWAATHDALTELVNRSEFETRVDAALLSARNSQRRHVLCSLDLDRFKLVNDSCGHAAGDALLKQLALVLQDKLRESDTLARLGGDEFGVLLEGCSLARARLIAADLLAAVRDHRLHWDGKTFGVGVSMGLVVIGPDSPGRDEILAAADTALYTAKEQGRDRACIYQASEADRSQRRGEARWADRLRRALAEDRLRLHYQPWLALQTAGAVADAAGPSGPRIEILLRLQDEDGRLVLPGSFLAAAERSHLMPEIDRWVIATVCARHAALALHFGPGLVCAIHLSAATLADEGLIGHIRDRAQALPPGALCFQIGESAAVNDLRGSARFVQAARGLGCSVALDGFGAGAGSLSCLRALPVDLLKIAGSITRGIISDPVDRALADTINHAGHLLGRITVAEAADTAAALAELRHLGVDYAQGLAVQEPLPLPSTLTA
ncbi:EAL domain-containing protein [Rubrivivax sp. A210]|uniref:EAL domain-containing protein n=1 Tax=Rubrivivax sp. A210 TaxID=2772301 RepID=UPI00191A3490|nr:EAL domain-containing protein [Rubrivivax sp. A210]CAD5374275.1 EAL domain-containing protein [Rubrivivax sp. A210]